LRQKRHSNLVPLRDQRGLYPNHSKPRLLVAILDADDFANLQGVTDVGKLRALAAEATRRSALKEGLTVRVHAPYPDWDIGGNP
jgi:hypothetical protein